MREIQLSQLLALIAVSFDTKKVTAFRSLVVFGKTKESVVGHSISISWKRGMTCGSRVMNLYMTLERFYDNEPIYYAYYFDGDNCNDRSRFLYSVMAEKTDIKDDIGLTGAGDKITDRTNLLKINPHDIELCRDLEKRWKDGERE